MAVFASIDLGTNTVRLLVAKKDGKGFKPLHSNQVITRLGEGLSNGGILIDKAMERTVNTILNFKNEVIQYNPSKIWIVATSAVREAKNRSEFIDIIKKATGLELEVIPWEEEARMTLLGVFSGLNSSWKKESIVLSLSSLILSLGIIKYLSFLFGNITAYPTGCLEFNPSV